MVNYVCASTKAWTGRQPNISINVSYIIMTSHTMPLDSTSEHANFKIFLLEHSTCSQTLFEWACSTHLVALSYQTTSHGLWLHGAYLKTWWVYQTAVAELLSADCRNDDMFFNQVHVAWAMTTKKNKKYIEFLVGVQHCRLCFIISIIAYSNCCWASLEEHI